ncbi:general secretion pathway protein GspM [Pseudoxanthomonas kalamensis DSM 18571]|uniref:type II secretion system protein GspM n=1 Tax=Pseudoxanthomonas kalamensis TaxID=289483 RepID=UPI001391B724|nr:type II secretion system protein GspM [Pseudoxanthomonas kalamensis]KAF1708869.1 general secretion pathway protein GspM [Pseudoxanthomonas kalamensis DSM 18571]
MAVAERISGIGRDRWLALGLLLAALALVYLLFVHPWWTRPMLEADAQVEQARQRELRVRMQLLQAPEIEQRLAEARTQSATHPGFLPEATVEQATAGLVKRLETVVADASPGNRSCAISNRSPLNVTASGRFQQVAVQVRLRCGVPQLAAALHALESGSPRLFVDNLNVLTQRGYPGQAVASGGLDVSFDLFGYLRPSATSAAAMDANGNGGADDAP